MVILGDTHENVQFLIDLVKLYPNKTNYIQLGDFGAGFKYMNFNENYKGLNSLLREKKSYMYVVRGNHDNPEFYNGQYMNTNLKLVLDYSLIEIEGKKILFIGGAISVDRRQRIPFISYWTDEVVKFNQEALDKIDKVDIVVSHTAPHFCYPKEVDEFVKVKMKIDKALVRELPAERKLVTQIYQYLIKDKGLKIPKWFYGHFHKTHMIEYHYGTMFKLLNICEIVELENDVKKNKKINRKSSAQ